MVRLPYCDGSVWRGTQTKMAPAGYVACGHSNAAAAFQRLINTTALGKAARVIVSGGSAGGVGAFAHADYVRELPALQRADVRAAPIAGWFYSDVANYSAWQRDSKAGFDWDKAQRLATIWTDADDPEAGWADESCKVALGAEAYKCASMDIAYAYIKTPLFVIENQCAGLSDVGTALLHRLCCSAPPSLPGASANFRRPIATDQHVRADRAERDSSTRSKSSAS